MIRHPRNQKPAQTKERREQPQDPLHGWLRGLCGVVVGAEDMLAFYERRLILEHEIRALVEEGDRTNSRWQRIFRAMTEG